MGDPEDGTTEKSKGQLSGGNNMGHKTGWCHTGSMRDPQQTTDYSRNSTMNSYRTTSTAARDLTTAVVLNVGSLMVDGYLGDWESIEQCNLAQCVADNGTTHLHLLNDVTAATDTFCTEIDTDGDSVLNYTLCHDATLTENDFVTLTACETAACENPEEIATYATNGYNADDSSIEIGIGLADIGLAGGDTVCLTNSVSSESLCHTVTADSGTVDTVPLAVTLNGVEATQTATIVTLLLLTISLSGFLLFTRRA